MAKRFVDTGIYDDPWFMNLSKEGKLLWLYFITKCNHAGILELNEKLCKVQTEIKDMERVIKELGNRLLRVNGNVFFIPKFIDFQYPDFPNSKVRQQYSALEILKKYNLFDGEKVTLTKVLTNPYEHEHDNDTVNDNVIVNDIDNENEKNENSKTKNSSLNNAASFSYISLDGIVTTPNQEMKAKWYEWRAFRKSIKKPFKTNNGENAAYKKLIELSAGNVALFTAIIQQSIDNEWIGFFPLKQTVKSSEIIIHGGNKRNGQRVTISDLDHSTPQTF